MKIKSSFGLNFNGFKSEENVKPLNQDSKKNLHCVS